MSLIDDVWNRVNNLSEEELNRKLIEININPKEDEFFDEKGKPIPLRIAQHILENYKIITPKDSEDVLYYNNGIYHNGGEILIKSLVQKLLNEKSSRYLKEEVIDNIKGLTYLDREEIEKNKHFIHLKNGIFNMKTFEFLPFDENIISTTQLPVKYNPKADCPKIKQFVKEVVGEDQFKVAQELFGYCLIRDYPFNKAFMLHGSGKNGKTTFLNLLVRFLGEDNVVNVSLHDLLYNRFSKAKLYGKLANIYDDLPNAKLTATGNFKILTGKGRIWADLKFKNGFEFVNYAKLIFSCNELPLTEDTTFAFFRRWKLLKFENVFDGVNEKHNILDEIVTEDELSGLFNWAVEGLKRIFEQNGFTKTKTTEDTRAEWILQTDQLRAFIQKYVEYDPNSYITKDDFFEKVNDFCEEHDVPKLSKDYIGKKLPTILHKVKTSRIRVDGERKMCWIGIKIRGGQTYTLSGQGSVKPPVDSNLKNFGVSDRIEGVVKAVKASDILNNNNNNNNNNNRYTLALDTLDRLDYNKILNLYSIKNSKSYFELETEAQKLGISPEEFEKIHNKLKKDGLIYEPRSGYYLKT